MNLSFYLQDVSRPDTPESQAPLPNHKFGSPKFILVFLGQISERHFGRKITPKDEQTFHLPVHPHMSITRKIRVLTFSTEDPAQTLLYSMAGKPQLMVLQREEKAPSMYVSLSSWESKAPVQWNSFLKF